MYCLTHTATPPILLLSAPQGGPAAKNPQYLHCVEHALGLGDWAKQHGATLIATDDKDRDNSGESGARLRCTVSAVPLPMISNMCTHPAHGHALMDVDKAAGSQQHKH